MHIVINKLSCRYWIFIFSWSFIIAMIMVGMLIWNFHIFMRYTDFKDGGKTVDISGAGLMSLIGITIGLISLSMWGATWGVDCYTSSPYCKEKWDREWRMGY